MKAPNASARGRLRLLGVALVGSLGLSSCLVLPFLGTEDPAAGNRGSGSGVPPVSTAVSTPPADHPELARFYSQSLAWSSCSGGECATLEVPVDYAHPDGQTIKLALLRVKARSANQRIGSLVVNPGGPGGSGVDYAKYANQIVGAPVRSAFDVVGFDPRGVGRSAPITCLDDAAMDAYLGSDPTPDTPAEEQGFVAAAKAFGQACQAKNPTLLAHVSTVEAARDMDILRATLGEAKLHYLGKSYGTFLGATYADLFPDKVGRFVLDGVLPPDLASADVNKGQAKGFEAATRAYVANCVAKGSCPIGSSVDEGLEWISDFLARLDSQPLAVRNDQRVTKLTEGWASIGLAAAMYAQSMWPALTQAFEAAKGGDGDPLMELANQYADRTSGGTYTGNLLQVINAVNCLDRTDTADIPTILRNAKAFSVDAPTWGTMLAWGSVSCGVWPVPATGRPHQVSAAGSGPIVVVGTTRDPATIYQWSVQLRKELANAVLISYDGDGHTAYTRSNACVDNPINDYYTKGITPKDGLTC